MKLKRLGIGEANVLFLIHRIRPNRRCSDRAVLSPTTPCGKRTPPVSSFHLVLLLLGFASCLPDEMAVPRGARVIKSGCETYGILSILRKLRA